MEVKEQTKMLFDGVDIIETHLKIQRPFNFESKVELETTVELMKSSDASKFTIIMKVHLFVKEYFELIVKGLGHFQLTDPDVLQQLEAKQQIHQNAPAIMFPYMRAFITTFTAQTGQSMPPLVLPVQFFQGDLPEIAAP